MSNKEKDPDEKIANDQWTMINKDREISNEV